MLDAAVAVTHEHEVGHADEQPVAGNPGNRSDELRQGSRILDVGEVAVRDEVAVVRGERRSLRIRRAS